jgi:hypothetical protein
MMTGACIRCTPVPAHSPRPHVAAALLALVPAMAMERTEARGAMAHYGPHVVPPVDVPSIFLVPILISVFYINGTIN